MCFEALEYYEFLKKIDFNPSSYKDIANSLMKNGVNEMYHAVVNGSDIFTLFTIPNLKIIWCCRCHVVADDKSTTDEHLHALVQYQNKKTHQAFKLRLKRAGKRLHPKTTFYKMLCPDHVVEVLTYITCEDGQKNTKIRDPYVFVGKVHTHYTRSVYDKSLLHKHNNESIDGCMNIRMEITEKIWEELSDEWLDENVSGDGVYALHHHENCFCENRGKGKQKKRKEFYETEKGMDIKKKYSEKTKQKNKLIEELRQMKNCGTQAELSKEIINKLLNML